MNPEYDRLLEARIDRELKALPNLKAPVELRSRVMSAIHPRSAKQAAWSAWPVGLRAATLLALAAGFGGMCFAAWQLREAEVFTGFSRSLGGLWASAAMLASLVQALFSAFVLVVKNLNGAIVIGLFVAAMLVYFTWVALGTLWFRLTFAQR